MPSVRAFIRTTRKDKEVNVRFRYTDGRNIQLFHTSDIPVLPNTFDEKRECIKAKIVFSESNRKSIDKKISDRKELIKDICLSVDNKSILTSNWLDEQIDRRLHPAKYEDRAKSMSFFDLFDEFLRKHPLSVGRKRHFMVLKRSLQRYELYKKSKLSINNITGDTLRNIEKFLKNECDIYEKHPEIYEEVPGSHKPKPRGQNTINGMFVKLRTFIIWCNDNEITGNNPFHKYSIPESVYGTPLYITLEERDKLYKADFSNDKYLEHQRDIFILQCVIGCRVSDLYSLTKDNIIDDAIEYIARKTKEGRPLTVRVPLNNIAKEILHKYRYCSTFLPFTNQPDYNEAIKKIFRLAGLKRPVVTLDPITRESVIKPLYAVASSHMARRTFVGNLYKKVKDPNLVGALSGHKEGSRAFARYRDIDEDMKRELVKMLE